MVLKMFAVVAGVALFAGTAALAGEYRPDDFLQLELSKAVLSPTPLGPEAHFEPVPIEAKGDHTVVAAQPDTKADVPRAIATRRIHVAKSHDKSHDKSLAASRRASAEPAATRPRGAARARLAHRRGNPFDAEAMDTRIQTWPCRPGNGAICNWR
ncbi:hypothetical protein [Bradyrhizobium sp. SZCCHNRI1003]|uniref:hypothetical protein n=1 Tax=Bradyrhizobium sp. SZCCHNRI1003 TaxID=3057275 RepID=UPI00291631D0|nr:hypothetical protein [Bradyrhizobium sp. SZCCHNRI1003]